MIPTQDAMREMGQLSDPVQEALRGMLHEFGDEHYHTCPADNDSGPCDCFAGNLIIKAKAALLAALRASPAEGEADDLAKLIDGFSKALLAKLRLAQANGRSGWDDPNWEAECQQGLLRHVAKGDPRDVAAYCAFLWHHDWITIPPRAAESPPQREPE